MVGIIRSDRWRLGGPDPCHVQDARPQNVLYIGWVQQAHSRAYTVVSVVQKAADMIVQWHKHATSMWDEGMHG